MTAFKITVRKFVILSLFPLAMAACSYEPDVSFSQDVKPVLSQYCLECHEAGGEGEVASGFNMASYESLIEGARFGPMIVAGDAEGSNMLVLMEGRADPSISMPHGQQETVPKADIQTIRMWIEKGARDN